MPIYHISSSLHSNSGGLPAAIRCFSHNFENSQVFSFSKNCDMYEFGPYESQWYYKPVSAIPLLRTYGYSNSRLDSIISLMQKNASERSYLVSHMLFQWHCQHVAHLSRKFSIPYFIVPHGSLCSYVMNSSNAHVKKLWLDTFGSSFLAKASSVIFASTREEQLARQICPKMASTVIPWSVSPPIDALNSDLVINFRNAIRKSLSLPQDSRLLISHGRFHSSKNLTGLIKGFNACNFGPEVNLILCGPAGDISVADLKSLLRQSSSNILVLDSIYDFELWQLLSACDFYISTSLKENFNFALVEALSVGLFSIVSPGNALWDDLYKCSFISALPDIYASTISRAIKLCGEYSQSFLDAQKLKAISFCRYKYSASAFVSSLSTVFT